MKYKIAAILMAVMVPSSVLAASPAPSDASPMSVGLKVAPTKYEETLQISQSKDGVIDVINISKVPVTVQPEVQNVRMVGDNGELQFYTGSNPFEFENLIQIDKTAFSLGVNEARHVKFRVTTPVGIFPGGHFGAVFFRVVPVPGVTAGDSLAQSGRVGTLLLFTVAGDVDQKGSLERLRVTKNTFADQKSFEALYANTGNTSSKPLGVAYQPVGELRLKDMAGVTIRRQPLQGNLVFPGAKRKLTASIRKPFWFGRYTAEVTLSPGKGKPVQTKSVSFWAVSPLAVLVLSGLLLVVVATIIAQRRRRKPLPKQVKSVSLMDGPGDTPADESDKS